MRNRMRKFWRFWFRKTDEDKEYIIALKRFLTELVRSHDDEIISVYVGGSWQRREAHAKSDCDVYVIIRDENKTASITERSLELANGLKPLDFSPHVYSLKELGTGKKESPWGWKFNRTAEPKFIAASLNDYSLFYGSKIDTHLLHIPEDDEMLKAELGQLKYTLGKKVGEMFPKEDMKLRAVCKWVFYVVHYETRLKIGKKFPFHREKLVRRFKKENTHIIHLCNEVRKDPLKYVGTAEDIYVKATEYADFVEKNYFSM